VSTHNHWDPHQAGAAGLLVVDQGRVLLQLRAQGVHEGGTWSCPGGARLKDETPKDAALRECAEETGIDPNAVKIVATYTDLCECGWNYTTLIANLIGTVDLRGNWESDRLEWVLLKDVDALDLHPGLRSAWPALRDMLKAGDTQPNISQVTEQLWTGGDRGRTTPATWLAQLQHAGITHIIDARQEGQPDQAYTQTHAPHIGYLHNPQPDLGQTMPDQWFDVGVDYALHALADPDARVLAHCQLGINRGPSMAYAVLLATGVTPEQARSTITAARPIARIRYADDATDWWANLTAPEPEVFYHGGAPGLHVGDMLLPPSITGATTTSIDRIPVPEMPASWEPSFHKSMAWIQQRENLRVFVTKDLIYATEVAALHHPSGTVYRVEPLDNLADRTLLGHSETTCDRAKILAIEMENVTSIRFILLKNEHERKRLIRLKEEHARHQAATS
jgi:dual specificity phosphatase 3